MGGEAERRLHFRHGPPPPQGKGGPGHKTTPKWGIKPPLKPPRVVLCPLLWGIKPPLLGDKTTPLGGYNHPLWGIKPPPLVKTTPFGGIKPPQGWFYAHQSKHSYLGLSGTAVSLVLLAQVDEAALSVLRSCPAGRPLAIPLMHWTSLTRRRGAQPPDACCTNVLQHDATGRIQLVQLLSGQRCCIQDTSICGLANVAGIHLAMPCGRRGRGHKTFQFHDIPANGTSSAHAPGNKESRQMGLQMGGGGGTSAQ